MTASRLPRRLALAGIVLGFVLMALYWYDYEYNPSTFQHQRRLTSSLNSRHIRFTTLPRKPCSSCALASSFRFSR